MDEKTRELERKARSGDLQAAIQWLGVLSRTDDLAAQYEAMMLVADLQWPGMLKQVKDINRMMDMLREQLPPRESYWSTRVQVRTSSNTGP